jgi:hypothetical protein
MKETTMPQFFVTIQLPDDFVPSYDEAVMRDMGALGEEMQAAGVTPKFASGLAPASTAKSLRPQADGSILVTDGPFLEAKEHVGGISIMEHANMDEAVEWARKGAIACRASGEVREMLFRPAPAKAD